MTMKRSYFILSVAVAALFAGACTNEIEDVFPQTAAQRLNEAEQECLDLLLSSENGWFIQYYPSSGREYGGFSFSARFDDEGNVTMTSELAADPAVTATSHYSINTSTSVTLTFDTYNSYFHSLSDPDIYGTNALGGDFEFAFESGDESRIVFRAIKTGNRIVFTALDDNTDVVAAISNVLDMKNQYFMSYTLGEGIEMECDPNGYNCLYYTPDPENPYDVRDVPFSYSVDGLTFYDPVDAGGVEVQDFVWNGETERYVSREDPSVELVGVRNPMYMAYEDYLGTYNLMSGTSAVMEVTLEPDVEGSTYTMNGFFGFSPTVTWTPSGYLTLMAQYLGPYGSNYAWLCPWGLDFDAGTGSFTWSTSVGFNLVNSGTDPDNLVLTAEGNSDVAGVTANSILVALFSSQTPSSSSFTQQRVDDVAPFTGLVKTN